MKHIQVSIVFGSTHLPVVDCADGHQRVPLKSIADEIGVNWKSQRRKFNEDDYLKSRLGLEYLPLKGEVLLEKAGNPNKLCIRLDRVIAFLNTINPSNLRSMGNKEAADWLEAKHSEWDDALYSYETKGYAAKTSESLLRESLYKLDKMKNPILKQRYAESINKEFGANIPLANQSELTLD